MFKKTILSAIFTSIVISSSVVANDSWRDYDPTFSLNTIVDQSRRHHLQHHAFVGKELLLNAKGNAVAYACEIPPTELGTSSALCFDIPLYNMKTGAYVGILKDRLADVTPQAGGGLLVTVTSTFKFTEWKKKPQFTTRVLGNVQPFIKGSPTMTHLTGAIPSAGDNDFLSGTKRFRHASGTARESGAINLSGFQGAVGDEVVFDLIWNIKFD